MQEKHYLWRLFNFRPGAKRKKRIDWACQMKYASVRSESIIQFSSRKEEDSNAAKPRPRKDPGVILWNLDRSLSAACAKFFFAYRRKETASWNFTMNGYSLRSFLFSSFEFYSLKPKRLLVQAVWLRKHFKVAAVFNFLDLFLSRWTFFFSFFDDQVPFGTFLTGKKTKKQKKDSELGFFLFLFHWVLWDVISNL
jgi:hypothetical protein